ncbi:MAG: heparinase II/III-family protein [Lachnospiraceae bacterium]|nr:heparinase II/III-family protein [Lachnospiraceae bacterium]
MKEHTMRAENRFLPIENRLPASFPDLFPPAADRDFWGVLDTDLREALLENGKEALETAWPQLLLSDYTDFSETGNRERFEEKYFTRRRMLCALTLAECAEYEGRFFTALLNGLYLILEETTWCLPAHNSYIRDGKQLAIPDEERPVIDLFAAETAALLGITEFLLRERLHEASPDISVYIEKELRRRILNPYLQYHFWWMGDGVQAMCNWTPWITQNLLLALSSRTEGFMTQEEKQLMLYNAVQSMDYFMDDYDEDGCCSEGAEYYSHAGLCLFCCIDILNHLTDDAFKPLFSDPLIKNMAAYILRMYVGNGYYINYGDCSPLAGKRGVRDYLFAKAVNNEEYASFAASDYRSQSMKEKLAPGEINLFYRLLQLKYHEEMEEAPLKPFTAEDYYFESEGLLIARDSLYVLSAKMGKSLASHSHEDIGSLTVYRDGEPVLIDLGVETYTKKTFSPDRHEIWTIQSAYHNTVNFGEDLCVLQKSGEECEAEDIQVRLTETEASLSAELRNVYADDRIRQIRRTVSLYKNREDVSVAITDHYDADLPAVLTFMTKEKPVQAGPLRHESVSFRLGDSVLLTADGVKNVIIEACPVRDAKLQRAWQDEVWRILLYTAGNHVSVVLG